MTASTSLSKSHGQSTSSRLACRLVAALTSVRCYCCLPVVLSGIGRFLRLTVSNIRLRIAYEDFPSTQRLVAMVQVRCAPGQGHEG